MTDSDLARQRIDLLTRPRTGADTARLITLTHEAERRRDAGVVVPRSAWPRSKP